MLRSVSALRLISPALAAALMLLLSALAVPAQETRQNEPGQFDYYVLSLSWSPSFCSTWFRFFSSALTNFRAS